MILQLDARHNDHVGLPGHHAARAIHKHDGAAIIPGPVTVRPDDSLNAPVAENREPVRGVGDKLAADPRCLTGLRWARGGLGLQLNLTAVGGAGALRLRTRNRNGGASGEPDRGHDERD